MRETAVRVGVVLMIGAFVATLVFATLLAHGDAFLAPIPNELVRPAMPTVIER